MSQPGRGPGGSAAALEGVCSAAALLLLIGRGMAWGRSMARPCPVSFPPTLQQEKLKASPQRTPGGRLQEAPVGGKALTRSVGSGSIFVLLQPIPFPSGSLTVSARAFSLMAPKFLSSLAKHLESHKVWSLSKKRKPAAA